METIGKFTVIIITLICAFLVSLLNVYVILSISNLYNLTFITRFSFVQIYGIIVIIGILRFKHQNKDSDKEFNETMYESFIAILSNIFSTLFIWGLSFIIYHIIS